MPDPHPLRILLLLEATLGGTGRHILDLTQRLLELDFEVHLVVSLLRADRQFVAGLNTLREQHPKLRVMEITIRRSVVPGDILVLIRLCKYVRANGPFDWVHAHSTKAGFLARILPGIPSTRRIYSPHALMTMNPDLAKVSRWAVSKLESALAHFCRYVIVGSEKENQCAIQSGIDRKKLIRIENGVDCEKLAEIRQRRAEIRRNIGVEHTKCIGYVGRLCEQKEPGRVLEAFAELKMQGHAVRLVFIGFGELEPLLRARAETLGIASDVIWLGPVDAREFICAFDVLALCSRYESFAYVFIEALASGVPVVSTNVGIAEELALAGAPVFLCDPWDASVFRETLKRVITASDSVKISEAAMNTARSFDLDRMVDQISRIYVDVHMPQGA